ncbi:MAG TPA: hypothetical protein VGG98_01765 [Solirubrobacteraceae bacterium]
MRTLRCPLHIPSTLLGLLLVLALGVVGVPSAVGHARPTHARITKAHAATSYLVGIGDEQPEMFTDPLWLQLHTKIARYIAPYDAAYHVQDLTRARQWISVAEAQHVQVLVAFYHSERTPTVLPSVALYQRDVKRFMKLFPKVRQYQPWNETNRGNVAHAFSSPSAFAAAQYYQALKRACSSCTVVGLDILDQQNVSPTMEYIAEFKRAIGRLRTNMPSIWGLHNYSDTNRFQSSRTRAILNVVPGQVWLTETGGIVQFGGAFPNRRGSGLTRSANALTYMFNLAGSNSRIKRLYIFQWSGATSAARFDAGLTDPHHKPRKGYVVVCRHVHGMRCSVKLSNR